MRPSFETPRKRAAAQDDGLSVHVAISFLPLRRYHYPMTPQPIRIPVRILGIDPGLRRTGWGVIEIDGNRLTVHSSPAHDDGSWISLCSPDSVQPLQAIATAVDPHIEVRVSGTDTDWTAELTETDATAAELPEVEVVKFSGGASFQFEPRRSLPLTVV